MTTTTQRSTNRVGVRVYLQATRGPYPGVPVNLAGTIERAPDSGSICTVVVEGNETGPRQSYDLRPSDLYRVDQPTVVTYWAPGSTKPTTTVYSEPERTGETIWDVLERADKQGDLSNVYLVNPALGTVERVWSRSLADTIDVLYADTVTESEADAGTVKVAWPEQEPVDYKHLFEEAETLHAPNYAYHLEALAADGVPFYIQCLPVEMDESTDDEGERDYQTIGWALLAKYAETPRAPKAAQAGGGRFWYPADVAIPQQNNAAAAISVERLPDQELVVVKVTEIDPRDRTKTNTVGLVLTTADWEKLSRVQ